MPLEEESWPGQFAYQACFGGAASANVSQLTLNYEPANMLKYLLPDSLGGAFVTAPRVTKASWPAPYDQILSAGAPARVIPTVRIPVTSGSYLYDEEANGLKSAGYRAVIDLLVQNFTSQGIAVIIDQHGCCADGGKLNCSSRGGPMALRDFGEKTGAAVAFWDLVAATYANNSLVLYETYNEPHVWYQALYGGDSLYAGHIDMYAAVRNRTSSGLVIIGGTGYAQDSAGLIAMSMQYARDQKKSIANVIWNLHPYQGAYQGVWISMRSTMRLTLALQTIGPVIWTELGQYCCNAGPQVTCQGTGMCNDHAHGDWFVYNVINMAAQLDVSWVGWAWRGVNANGGTCAAGQAECNTPDMRDFGGVLTNGSSGGANWTDVWSSYVASPEIIVRDEGNHSAINVTAYEVKGFLPRPCIVPGMGMGNACGWPLGFNTSALPWNSMWNQSVSDSVLPGLPPRGSLDTCLMQACDGYECSPYSSIVPMPEPC